MVIYKYELKITDKQNIEIGGLMPCGFSVNEQNGKLMMWVQLDEDYPGSFNLDVDIIGTGNTYQTEGKFIGTVLMSNGAVWHIFAKVNYIRSEMGDSNEE